MLKKYFIGLLTLAILNLTGCYSLEIINKEDVNEGRAQINLSEELFLTTKDFTRYHFLPANFRVASDTLYGKGTIEDSSSIIPFQGSIALTDVVSFRLSLTQLIEGATKAWHGVKLDQPDWGEHSHSIAFTAAVRGEQRVATGCNFQSS